MDLDGVHAQLCFPSLPGFAGSTFFDMRRTRSSRAACVQAWNDFAIDEWCAAYPDRQIPLVHPALLGRRPEHRRGRSGWRRRAPRRCRSPRARTPRACRRGTATTGTTVLAAAQDADLPLCLHFGSGGAPNVAPDAQLRRRHRPVRRRTRSSPLTELLLSPVFHKFPRLKVALSEGGIGWMPYDARAHRLHVGAPPPLHGRATPTSGRRTCSASTSSAASSPTTPASTSGTASASTTSCSRATTRTPTATGRPAGVVLEKVLADVPDARGPQDRRGQRPAGLQLPSQLSLPFRRPVARPSFFDRKASTRSVKPDDEYKALWASRSNSRAVRRSMLAAASMATFATRRPHEAGLRGVGRRPAPVRRTPTPDRPRARARW